MNHYRDLLLISGSSYFIHHNKTNAFLYYTKVNLIIEIIKFQYCEITIFTKKIKIEIIPDNKNKTTKYLNKNKIFSI